VFKTAGLKNRAACAVLMALIPVISASQTTPNSIIAGRVTREDSGEPIEGASVYYSNGTNLIQPDEQQVRNGALRGPNRNTPKTTTDSEGWFRLQGIRPGTYRLLAIAPGYVSREYGQINLRRPGLLVNITPAERKENLVIPLVRNGEVRGRVVNDKGEGLQGMSVGLSWAVYNSQAERVVEAIATTKSGAGGDFHFVDVPPGQYYLVAGPVGRVPLNTPRVTGEPQTSLYSLTFWPSADSVDTATLVEVRPGQRTDWEIRMRGSRKLLHIRGRLEDPVTGKWPQKAAVRYSHPITELDSGISGGGPENYNPSDGTFELSNLEPGLYAIRVAIGDMADRVPSAFPTYWAYTSVLLGDTNIDSLVLSPLSLALIRGQVRLDSEGLAANSSNSRLDFARVKVMLQPTGLVGTGAMVGMPLEAQAGQNGVLQFAGLLAAPDEAFLLGDYRISIRFLPESGYVSRIDLNGTDVTEKRFPLSASISNVITVHIRPGAAEFEITARDLKGQPVSAADVAVVPYRQLDSLSRFRSGRTDATGRFVASNLPPGEYQLFAWEGIPPYGYFDPDLRSRSEADSRRFVVTAGQRISTDVIVRLGNR
jgi:hypothetical protein